MPAGPGLALHHQVRFHPRVDLAPGLPHAHHHGAAQRLADSYREDGRQPRRYTGGAALVPDRQDQMVRSVPGPVHPTTRASLVSACRTFTHPLRPAG
ncbi:hypothetical protein ACFU8Q_18425 [Streptomyces sp. NPDC057543]|uniref:hypothetical protein n=1 Tax=Streptomyces sp. NPDC057543 TaxID=3346163 RepID=UPI0036AC8F95